MTKIALTIAAAAIAASALFTSAAQACISCNYTPEVVTAGQKKAARREVYVAKPAPMPRKRIAKIAPAPKKKMEIAKAPAPKKIETAKAPEPVAKPPVTAAAEPAATESTSTPTREKPISTAALIEAGGNGQTEEPQAVEEAQSCKKFFPAVGMTLTVPCE